MPDTPHLGLPLLAPAQAQKHVTHNEALLAIDALLHLAVLDKDLVTPPSGPPEGARYIVPAGATDAWAGQSGTLASWQDGGWDFYPPRAGFIAFVIDEGLLYLHTGSAWLPLTSALAAIQNLGLLGIGTTADATNRFAAKLNTALWTALTTGEGGSGDLRSVMNKQAPSRVLSLLLQSGFSGRAEIGLVGSDELSLRMSPDGSTWTAAAIFDGAGRMRLPAKPVAYVQRRGGNISVGAFALTDIPFDTALVNRGGLFNASTGKFTCPVDGTYRVTCNLLSSAGVAAGRDLIMYMLRNGAGQSFAGSTVSDAYSVVLTSSFQQHVMNGLVSAAAGDVLSVGVVAQSSGITIFGTDITGATFEFLG
ncbi:MAG: DUF2793 domain-containing protein [Methylobacteriaceae bacterium]|nr:DUF2793 domain-containing protein [Methylobacteriaceae bacterium]